MDIALFNIAKEIQEKLYSKKILLKFLKNGKTFNVSLMSDDSKTTIMSDGLHNELNENIIVTIISIVEIEIEDLEKQFTEL